MYDQIDRLEYWLRRQQLRTGGRGRYLREVAMRVSLIYRTTAEEASLQSFPPLKLKASESLNAGQDSEEAVP